MRHSDNLAAVRIVCWCAKFIFRILIIFQTKHIIISIWSKNIWTNLKICCFILANSLISDQFVIVRPPFWTIHTYYIDQHQTLARQFASSFHPLWEWKQKKVQRKTFLIMTDFQRTIISRPIFCTTTIYCSIHCTVRFRAHSPHEQIAEIYTSNISGGWNSSCMHTRKAITNFIHLDFILEDTKQIDWVLIRYILYNLYNTLSHTHKRK